MSTHTLVRRPGVSGYFEMLRRMRWDRLLVIPASLALWILAIYAVRAILNIF